MYNATTQQIEDLKPGQSIRVSGNRRTWCAVERSGNGKVLRWVRHSGGGFKVFHAERLTPAAG